MDVDIHTLEGGGQIRYWPSWVSNAEANELFKHLLAEMDWQGRSIRLFGREIVEPRLSDYCGDAEALYRYSGSLRRPRPWEPRLAELRAKLLTDEGLTFNSVLCNLYRDHRDSMGMHCDDEPELGEEPCIASISLGAERRFRIKHRGGEAKNWFLEHGSLLVMEGPMQKHWKHGLPKRTKSCGPRINLSFRLVVSKGAFVSERGQDQ